MIISASRRTDIPAFYAEWFISRIRAGYCVVPNPFDPSQVSYVSLKPEDVEVIVFWTRHPRPLIPYLAELDERGYRYYFQYTLMNNPRSIDPKGPALDVALRTFCELADRIGSEKVIWRYDPIVFSQITDAQFHRRTYEQIARQLRGHTRRSVISVVDIYPKIKKRLRTLAEQGIDLTTYAGKPSTEFDGLMRALARAANENEMEIVSCAEELDLQSYGIRPGKCIDDEYIERALRLKVTDKKDPAQRDKCGCVVSKDIGMYESCLFGCQYCYATSRFDRAQRNHDIEHHPDSPSLLGWYDAVPMVQAKNG